MVGEAVDLHDEPLRRPQQVDLVAAEPCVYGGRRQLGGPQQREQALLSLRAGERRGGVGREHRGEGARPAAAGGAIEQRPELGRAGQAPELALLHRAPERVGVD
ncbi:MAG TPA: hypothetical protein VE780_08520 [Thermoleophilaceae bacterium]|nr:hypothetical protein [Thermoleophilaceae bacterium]